MNFIFLKHFKYYFFSLLGLTLIFASSYNISIASSKDAQKFVNEVSNDVITLMKREDLNNKQKQDKLEVIFKKSVDTEWIGKFALGRQWKLLNTEAQQEYLDLFSQYLINLYVPNFSKYTTHKLKMINVSETASNEYLVQTEMHDVTSNAIIKINYRLIQKGSYYTDFVIFDIIIEGISLISTQRSEFSSIIEQNSMEYLLEKLKSKAIKTKN